MPTTVGIFNIYEQENFHAQLSIKLFHNLGALSGSGAHREYVRIRLGVSCFALFSVKRFSSEIKREKVTLLGVLV